jgi:MerR HTH family regulatory protein
LYTYEQAAVITGTSTVIIEQFVSLGSIEPVGSMLHAREITRIDQIQRLRRDLGLNLVGAMMVIDMAQEIAQLRARLSAVTAPTASQSNDDRSSSSN